jgi:hypothetical protein
VRARSDSIGSVGPQCCGRAARTQCWSLGGVGGPARNTASSADGPIAEANSILKEARRYDAQADAACDRLGG